MTNRIRHRASKRADPAVPVSKAQGFQLYRMGGNSQAGTLKGKQSSSIHNRRNVKITLPTLSILKED